jgi:8-oxo-dGTP pyrophosphatase MutT (NUDIX family)
MNNSNKNLVPYMNINNMKRFDEINQCGVILLNGFSSPLVLLIFQKASQKWGLPKGHLTDREKYRKDYYLCAKRELFEETGIYLSTNKHKYWGSVLLNNKMFYVIQIFKDYIYVNPIDKNEISKYKWYPIFELENFVKNNNCNRTIKDLMYKMREFQKPRENNYNKLEYKNFDNKYLYEKNNSKFVLQKKFPEKIKSNYNEMRYNNNQYFGNKCRNQSHSICYDKKINYYKY